jgi:hypothetical protein
MNQIQTVQEKKRALDILEKAFINSKGMTWMIKRKSKTNLRVFLTYLFNEARAKKGTWLTTDNDGVVFFYHLKNRTISFRNIFLKPYVILVVMGYRNGWKAYKYKNIIDATRPQTGWFGWLFATDNTNSGVRAAYEIKEEIFKMADGTKEPIYVETTAKRAMTLYKASGYYEYAKMKHPYENLTIWFMKRDPKVSA